MKNVLQGLAHILGYFAWLCDALLSIYDELRKCKKMLFLQFLRFFSIFHENGVARRCSKNAHMCSEMQKYAKNAKCMDVASIFVCLWSSKLDSLRTYHYMKILSKKCHFYQKSWKNAKKCIFCIFWSKWVTFKRSQNKK